MSLALATSHIPRRRNARLSAVLQRLRFATASAATHLEALLNHAPRRSQHRNDAGPGFPLSRRSAQDDQSRDRVLVLEYVRALCRRSTRKRAASGEGV